MSSELLKKSLALDDAFDGVRVKSKKKKNRNLIVQQEREMLKENPLVSKLSTKRAKQGYSLVDQYRDNLPKNVKARNERYLELTGRATVPNEVTRCVTKKVIGKVKRNKKRVL